MTKTSSKNTLERARQVLEIEAQEILSLANRLDDHFVNAVQLILHCDGRVVVSGMGKSGHIGRKLASTFASTGTPSFFMHPAEASHGDLGMIKAIDLVLAISNSGESDEINAILPNITEQKRLFFREAYHPIFFLNNLEKKTFTLILDAQSNTFLKAALYDLLCSASEQIMASHSSMTFRK